MVEPMLFLVLQLGVIIFAAWAGGLIFKKIHLPVIMGEITAGIIIGPYLLGGFQLPLLKQPLFLLGGNFPVSLELYGFATVASIILLFLIGLETDLKMVLKYSLAGSLVGLGGFAFSFLLGSSVVVLLSRYLFGVQYGFLHPLSLLLGVTATATSVGITAHILSERKKMHSPEGTTIISGAIIDDILGVVALAVIIGLIRSGEFQWLEASGLALRFIFIWLGFTLIAILLSRQISFLLKKIKDTTVIAIISLGMAFILAGVFEKAGLAMIIGAYVMGLSLSATDLSYLIQEKLSSLYKFFVPIFFCVIGMMIDISVLTSLPVIFFGFIYAIVCIFAKIIGCGIPSLFLNFNFRGALRIGVGMVPRGEVALIIAGIGLTAGILSQQALGAIIVMTVITSLSAPVVFSALLKSKKPALRKAKPEKEELITIDLPIPNLATLELILAKIISSFNGEGFFVNRINAARPGEKLFQIRKDRVFITMKVFYDSIEFNCKREDIIFINTFIYEIICDLENAMHQLEKTIDNKSLGKKIFAKQAADVFLENKLAGKINPKAVRVNLKSSNKESLIKEMVGLIVESGQLDKAKEEVIIQALFEREEVASTGMEYGIAIPHTKTSEVNSLICALGVKREGIEFESLDGKKATIFVMILSPLKAAVPHIKFMADVSQLLANPLRRQQILKAKNDKELFQAFLQ